MGLKGAPGIRYATANFSVGDRTPRRVAQEDTNDGEPAKRIKHQGPPGFAAGQQNYDDAGIPSQAEEVEEAEEVGARGREERCVEVALEKRFGLVSEVKPQAFGLTWN